MEIQMIAEEGMNQGIIREGASGELAAKVFDALAGTVAQYATLHPELADEILAVGFKLFWFGIAHKGKNRGRKINE